MHLVPFSLPIISSLRNQQGKQLETRKCGSIDFEVQVLDRDPTSSVLPTNEDIVKLSLHQLQGLYDNSTLLDTLSSTAHLRVLLLRSGSHSNRSSSGRKYQLQRETLLHDVAVHLRPGAESSEVDETVDISQAIGSLGGQKQDAVLAVQVCDVARNPLGQTHIRIGKDWKMRLPQKQKAWYPLYASGSNEATARIQLSFSLISKQEANKSAKKVTNITGKLYVE
uniref:Uncharacterized protein n=1 Tax=Globisporangium ultimum (strain ATCC 200006 / CBS 805.95 / DAOM BR144) TaxID=431595 RepID=K3WU60_GLOUD